MQNSISKLLIFVFIALFSIGTVQAAEKLVVDPDAPVYVTLKPFTVSLPAIRNGYEVNKVLFVGITLRVSNLHQETIINTYLPEIRSSLLLLLLNQSIDDLEEESGKIALKDLIKQSISRFYNDRERVIIDDVLFTDFIIR